MKKPARAASSPPGSVCCVISNSRCPASACPELRIDGALVKNPEQVLAQCRTEAATFAVELGVAHADEIKAFAERFQREHGFTLDFDSTAIAAMAARAQREGMHVEAMCAKLFKDYPFGLKLVTRSTGETRFTSHSRGGCQSRQVRQRTRRQRLPGRQ
jgi:hypothetical protein